MSRLSGDDDAEIGDPDFSGNGNEELDPEPLSVFFPAAPDVRISEDHVHSVLGVRRGREEMFGKHLFSDPAWDIMLELYAAELGKRQMSPSELARSIAVPQSVILRWVAALSDADIVCSMNADDAEQSTVQLTQHGFAKMAQLAEQWGSAFVAI